MQNYEIVFIIHPDYSEKVSDIINQYTSIINKYNGKVHRLENWGRRQLSYPIKKLHKAHYILLNAEVTKKTIQEINMSFRINDAIIRSMILKVKYPITESSIIIKNKDNKIN